MFNFKYQIAVTFCKVEIGIYRVAYLLCRLLFAYLFALALFLWVKDPRRPATNWFNLN